MRYFFTFACLLLAALPSTNAANFPYIRLNGKTNQISDSGTALIRDGVPIGSGGSSLWSSSTAADSEGGTISTTSLTNLFGTNLFRIGENYLTNSVGSASLILSAGTGTPDPAVVGATAGNFDLFFIGDLSGTGSVFSAASQIYNIGSSSGSYANYTNVFNVFNVGDLAGDHATSFNSSYIFNFGDDAGSVAVNAHSQELYHIGNFAGYGSTYTNCYDIYDFGSSGNYQVYYTNDTSIYAIGGGLQGATLKNSKRVLALGQNAGNAVNGSYTNVIFIGDGSTAGATGSDQVILGSGMGLTVGAKADLGSLHVLGTSLFSDYATFAGTVQLNGQQSFLNHTYFTDEGAGHLFLGDQTGNPFTGTLDLGKITVGTTNIWTLGAVSEGGVTNITITINGKTYTLRAN